MRLGQQVNNHEDDKLNETSYSRHTPAIPHITIGDFGKSKENNPTNTVITPPHKTTTLHL